MKHQQETIKNYKHFLVKDLKDWFIGMNIKIDNQMIIKLQLVNLDFFLNHNFLEPIDYLL